MDEKGLSQKNYAKSYIITILLISWIVEIILFINPTIGLNYFPLVMFIPAVTVFIFNIIQHKNGGIKHKRLFSNLNLKSLLFSILYPIMFVAFCSIIVGIAGIGNFNFSKLITINIIVTISNIVVGLFGAFGEEYGWRGYLLPELVKTKGKIKSTISEKWVVHLMMYI